MATWTFQAATVNTVVDFQAETQAHAWHPLTHALNDAVRTAGLTAMRQKTEELLGILGCEKPTSWNVDVCECPEFETVLEALAAGDQQALSRIMVDQLQDHPEICFTYQDAQSLLKSRYAKRQT